MKTLACGDIMAGCTQTFQAETEDEILAQAGPHVVGHHQMEVTPELVEVVRSHIQDTSQAPTATATATAN